MAILCNTFPLISHEEATPWACVGTFKLIIEFFFKCYNKKSLPDYSIITEKQR